MDNLSMIEGVIREALDRHREGERKYGVFDPVSDRRDLFGDIEEELLDSINYAVFMILKIRGIKAKYEREKKHVGKIGRS